MAQREPEAEGSEQSVEQVVAIVHDQLAGGPMRLSGLVGVLLATPAFPADLLDLLQGNDGGSGGSARTGLSHLVEDVVLHDDRLWATAHDDPWYARLDRLVDPMVLTHRVTEQERAEGALPVVPDLVAHEVDALDGLDVPGLGRLQVGPGPTPSRPGHDNSVVRGPSGWLDGFEPGDLLAFNRRGTTVEVTRVDDLSPDDEVVTHLGEAARERLRDERGEEAYPLVLDAMTTHPEAFRRPARPLGELLTAAGLERRGFSWGRRGRPWVDAAHDARRMARIVAARRFGFDRCCLAALDRVLASVDGDAAVTSHRLGPDLRHGWVGDAVVDHVQRFPDHESSTGGGTGRVDRLAQLAAEVAAGPRPDSAAGHLVLALLADASGEPLLAETLVHDALADDPGFVPAARRSILYQVDRGDLPAAVTLLDRSGSTLPGDGDTLLRRLVGQMASPYRGTGRNQPCPCGSGRKFKACCLGRPNRSPRMVGALVDLRLHMFVHDEHDDTLTMAVAATTEASSRHDVGGPAVPPVVADLVAFEGGFARRYLDRRGELLPADERAILEAAVDESRRLWEIVEVIPGSAIVVHDPDTGRKATVHDPIASRPESIGRTLLWRIPRVGEIDYPVGFQIEVRPEEEAPLLALLASAPTALDLASWYRDLPR